jgi:hypothetical protein
VKEQIQIATGALVGKPLWGYRRAGDMAMFHFGNRIATTTVRGDPAEVGEYALHVQCTWRLTLDERVVTARRDLYFPADGSNPTEDFDYEHTPNLQDRIIGDLFRQRKLELTVLSVEVAEAARLHIVLDERFALDVMPDDSSSDEHWRLFVPGDDQPHFVVAGAGIE